MTDRTEDLLNLLEDINRIPRKSGNREPITGYFKGWAKEHGFSFREDHVQNLVIDIPPSKGYENSALVALQGHSDMVCEKTPESKHDFSKDPIKHKREGDWLSAEGTSLGADNGIGLAMAMMAAVDSEVAHPPLELVITTDEEIGLWGADEIKRGFIKSEVLINLDSEDLGIFTVGCAGAVISHLDYHLPRTATPEKCEILRLEIGGFKGGHSGGDIHKNRGNATAELVRGLYGLHNTIPFCIAEIKGGSAMNAISRSAEAIIAVESSRREEVQAWWSAYSDDVVAENRKIEETAFGAVSNYPECEEVFSSEQSRELLAKLRLVPHGVVHMNAELPDQVETSVNFGVVLTTPEGVRLTTMQRGSVKSRLHEITDRIETLASVTGATYTLETFMDPWQPNWESPLVAKGQVLWEKLFGEKPELEVTHGALECGVIGNLSGGMDMISFGPDIEDPHSPDERLKISSVGKSYRFLQELLASLK